MAYYIVISGTKVSQEIHIKLPPNSLSVFVNDVHLISLRFSEYFLTLPIIIQSFGSLICFTKQQFLRAKRFLKKDPLHLFVLIMIKK